MGIDRENKPTSRDFAWADVIAAIFRDYGRSEMSEGEQIDFVYETARTLARFRRLPVESRRELVHSLAQGAEETPQNTEANIVFADRYRLLLGQALRVPSQH